MNLVTLIVLGVGFSLDDIAQKLELEREVYFDKFLNKELTSNEQLCLEEKYKQDKLFRVYLEFHKKVKVLRQRIIKMKEASNVPNWDEIFTNTPYDEDIDLVTKAFYKCFKYNDYLFLSHFNNTLTPTEEIEFRELIKQDPFYSQTVRKVNHMLDSFIRRGSI